MVTALAWPRRPAVAAGLAVLAIVLLLAFGISGVPHATPGGDAAMTELYTWHASESLWLYGPYSRFGWHHPGPLLFYLYAPWYALTGRHPAAVNAAALAINAAAVAAIVWLLARRRGGAVSWAVLAALAVFVWRFGGIAASAWNPHVLVLPFAAMLVSAAALAAGEAAALLPMIAAASLVAQSHLGLVPAVGLTLAMAMAAAATRYRGNPSFRPAAVVSAAMAFVLWLPVVIEAVWGSPGNPARIYAFFSSATAAGAADAWLPLSTWADLVTAMSSGDPLVQAGEAYSPVGGRVALAMALLQTAVLPVVAWWAFRTARPFHGWLAVIVAAVSLTALAGLHSQWRIEGEIKVHTTLWLIPIGALNVAAVAAAVAALAAPLVPGAARIARNAFAPACTLALALLILWSGYQFSRLRDNADRAARHPTDTDRIVENTARYLGARGFRHPLVIVEAPMWHHAAAVVLHLARSEADVSVQPELARMFGASLVKDAPRDVIIRIVDRAGAMALTREAAPELVLERDTVLVYALPISRAP